MKTFALISLLFFSQVSLGCQTLCNVEMKGMANVGDFMRVKELDSAGEVKSMEALPAGNILHSFSTVRADAAETRLAKIMEIQVPLVGDRWEGSFLVANLGDFSILNLSAKTDGTGMSYLTGSISSATGTRFAYYYAETIYKFTVYVGATNGEKMFSGFSLLNTDPDRVTFYTNSLFDTSAVSAFPLAHVASVDDSSGVLLANKISPITSPGALSLESPLSGMSLSSFGDLSLSSATGNITLQDSEDWHEVGTTGNAAFQNGWTNYGGNFATAAYRKTPDGTVHIKGLVKNGTENTTIFTLPAEYRPAKNRIFTARVSAANSVRLDVTSGGEVKLNGAPTEQIYFTSIEAVFQP